MSIQAAIKLHRRVLRLSGDSWTVLSLRPGDPAAFATNRFDDAWHILGGPAEAELLARLFWALAFQRHERTLMLVDRPFLAPNPGEQSPIVLVNSNLGTPQRNALDELHDLLPLAGPSLGTVKLRTVGLDRALADADASPDHPEPATTQPDPRQWRAWIDRVHGLLVYAAPDAVLRKQAVMIAELLAYMPPPTADGHAVSEPILERSTRASAHREELFPGRAHVDLSDDERSEIWRRSAPD